MSDAGKAKVREVADTLRGFVTIVEGARTARMPGDEILAKLMSGLSEFASELRAWCDAEKPAGGNGACQGPHGVLPLYRPADDGIGSMRLGNYYILRKPGSADPPARYQLIGISLADDKPGNLRYDLRHVEDLPNEEIPDEGSPESA